MNILTIHQEFLVIPEDRQRSEFDPAALVSLGDSIASIGLIHPIVVVKTSAHNYTLVAGERRFRALSTLWAMGETVKCAGQVIPPYHVPCIDQGSLTQEELYEMELAENIERMDLSWQEKAQATAKFAELKRLQATKANKPLPTNQQIGTELRPTMTPIAAAEIARDEIMVARLLKDEEISKAPTLKAALKMAKRKEELAQSARLGESVGRTFSSSDHTLLNRDCITALPELQAESQLFDCILSDPPYGMGAQDFADSGEKANGAHFYDDSYETWINLMSKFIPLTITLTKPQAHLYLFCDFDRFHELKIIAQNVGWTVFRTPLIWINHTANRAPWPNHGPMRKWQTILYAVKGKKPLKKLAPDTLTFPSDTNLNHQAQKPIALYQELLARSCDPGNSVLDPFCGTGPIFPAAHALKIKATGIELDPSAYGIAVKRLEALR